MSDGMLSAIGGLGAMFALVLGLLYLARSTADRDWPVAGLGLWLLAVAAVCGLAGPRAVWGIDALAVGLAFLVTAALRVRAPRS